MDKSLVSCFLTHSVHMTVKMMLVSVVMLFLLQWVHY